MKLRYVALVLVLAFCARIALGPTSDREPGWRIDMDGVLHPTRGGHSSSNDTRIANPASRTRRLTITWRPPSCDSTNVSIALTNHYGKPIYDGDARCEPFVVPIPAGQLVNLHLYGRGSYDLELALD